MGRPFSSSYLADDPAARSFLPFDFRAPADRAARTRAAAARRAPSALVEVLRAQQAALGPSPARAAALDALADGNTAVVATGQQVGLFLGPLYGFYKAASAIAVARALEAETGVRTIPLFWLQTEDHDFAEIASVTVEASDGAPCRLALAGDPATPARSSVAYRRLGPEVGTLLTALGDALGDAPAATETLAVLGRHYRSGETMASAFAGVMAELFADEGLLFLDPRHEAIAALAAPIHREALASAGRIEERMAARAAALAEAGFDPQIPARPGCALSFFHPDGPTGDRFRLARDASLVSGWRLSGRETAVAEGALEAALARTPLCFSTSALLRPILQDTLLPTAAYVGGPAELSYFAQLGPLYDWFGPAPPLVVPRARFRCLDAGTRRRLEALGLTPDDVSLPRAELLARLARQAPPDAPDPNALAAAVTTQILPLVERVTAGAAALDPADRNFVRAAARTRATVDRALGRLVARASRKLAERDTVALARLDRVQAALHPNGAPQERVYGWPSLAGRHGPAGLKRLVFDRLAEAGPFPTGLLDLRP